MHRNPFAPDFKDLPDMLPIFPLRGVLLLPSGQLPLNIFEPRYVAMIEDALAGNRMIGMVQPQGPEVEKIEDDTPVFAAGCAGKITEFSETGDGRFLVTLTGISRFDISEELLVERGYRRARPSWKAYKDDLDPKHCLDLDRARLRALLEQYFVKEGMDCDWGAIDEAPDGRLITCLSMVCPFDAREKQALLEAKCCKTRAEMFMTMLDMAVRSGIADSHH